MLWCSEIWGFSNISGDPRECHYQGNWKLSGSSELIVLPQQFWYCFQRNSWPNPWKATPQWQLNWAERREMTKFWGWTWLVKTSALLVLPPSSLLRLGFVLGVAFPGLVLTAGAWNSLLSTGWLFLQWAYLCHGDADAVYCSGNLLS